MTHTIETERLRLVACDVAIMTALLVGKATVAQLLNVAVPNRLSSYGKAPYRYTLAKLHEDPGSVAWWMYLPILKAENLLIGTCGYKGPPDEKGIVEIGYEIIPAYRRRGLGKEVAEGLIDNAFTNSRVSVVQAHTLARINPSVKILQACGLTRTEELTDPEDGLIWRWQLSR